MSKTKKIILIAALACVAIAAIVTAVVLLVRRPKPEEDLVLPDTSRTLVKSGHKLVIGGVTEYVILLPENYTTNEYLAAEELQTILRDATGAEMDIVFEGEYTPKDGAPLISIGNTALAQTQQVRTDKTDLLRSGYYVRTVDNRLFILSDGSGIALCYAVYDLCEDAVGYRYYAADEIRYRTDGDVELYVYDGRVMPDLDFRATLYPTTSQDADYRRHLRYFLYDEEFGGQRAHGQTSAVVNFDKFKATHGVGTTRIDENGNEVPDHWFSRNAAPQLCWTAGEEMERQAASDLFRIVSASSSEKIYFHIGQEDNANYCTCDRCKKALSEWAYNNAGLQIAWANHVCGYLHEMLENAGMGERDVRVVIFAYMGTETPPVVTDADGNYRAYSDRVKPCDMLYFEWAPIYTDYSVNYSHVNNKDEYTNLQMWKALFAECGLVNRMSVWTYETNFKFLMFPFDNAGTFADNMKFFCENGINNVFSQGANQTNIPSFQEMRLFVESQLMWDTSLNYDALVNEFMAAYYDDAATAVRGYYDAVRLRYQQAKLYDGADLSSIYSDISDKKIWTEGFISYLDTIFAEAYASILPLQETDPERYETLHNRIKKLEITLICCKLTHYTSNYSQSELDTLVDEWKYYTSKFGITRTQENNPPDLQTMFDAYHS